MTEEQLSALLRLKRHETPPPGYFDRLLADVHRRQRAELLQRPLWKIALERFQTFFGEHSMGPLSYAGAVASVVAIGALGIGTFSALHDHLGSPGSATVAASKPASDHRSFTLQVTPPKPFAPQFSERQHYVAEVRQQPRYVIDARPVSYERPSTF
jgi:hypothetical protein